jgi:hypothetical protein
MGKHRLWTVVDDKFIASNYENMSASQIAKHLKTTQGAVYGRVKKLGVQKKPKLIPPQTKQIVVDNKNLQSIEFDIQGVKIHMVFK